LGFGSIALDKISEGVQHLAAAVEEYSLYNESKDSKLS